MTGLSHKLPNCIICGSAAEAHSECDVQWRVQCSNRGCLSDDAIAPTLDEAAAEWTRLNTPISTR